MAPNNRTLRKSEGVEVARDPPLPKLKALGGSDRDAWNRRLSNLVVAALPVDHASNVAYRDARVAALSGLADMNPADPVEAVLIGQLVIANEAALEMYRRAWLQSSENFEVRTRYLALADKAARTVALLTEALNRHRGKGAQKVTVEHVHVHSGGQAVVGVVAPQGGGGRAKTENQPHAISHAPEPQVWCPHTPRDAVPVARDVEWTMPDARRPITRRAEG